jgi:flagellar motor switch protein FliN/FliY
MPDLTYAELSELTHVITLLGPGISLELSKQTNREIALETPEVDSVPIQDILQSAASVVQTVFTLSAPFASENVMLIPRELVGQFLGARAAAPDEDDDTPGESLPALSESDLGQIGTILAAAARGFAQSIGDFTGTSVDLESHSTTQGSMNLPPIFAMEGNAIRADFPLNDPGNPHARISVLVTPEFARQLLPAADGGDGGGDEIIGEDDLAAMLSGLSGTDEPTLPAMPPPPIGMPERGDSLLGSQDSFPRGLDLILDIPLEVTVELGRVRMLIKDVIELSSGSIIELDRVAGEPVDLFVNGRLVAKGEVVVIEDNFGLRITEIVSPADRVAGLGKGR